MAQFSSVQILATSASGKDFIEKCEAHEANDHTIDYLATDTENGNTALHIALHGKDAFDPDFVTWYVTKAPEVLAVANAEDELPVHILAKREPNKHKIDLYKTNCAAMMENPEHLEARNRSMQTPRAVAIKSGNHIFLAAERLHETSHKQAQQQEAMLALGKAMAFCQRTQAEIRKLGTEYRSIVWSHEGAISFDGAELSLIERTSLKKTIQLYQFRINQREPIGTELRDLITEADRKLNSEEPIRAVDAFQLTTLMAEDLITVKNALDAKMGFNPRAKPKLAA